MCWHPWRGGVASVQKYPKITSSQRQLAISQNKQVGMTCSFIRCFYNDNDNDNEIYLDINQPNT